MNLNEIVESATYLYFFSTEELMHELGNSLPGYRVHALQMSIIDVVRKVISVLRLGTVANQSIILRCQHESNGKGNR